MVRKTRDWPGGKAPTVKEIGPYLFSDPYAVEEAHKFRINRWQFIIHVGGDPETPSEAGCEPGVEHRMADRFDINLNILSGIDSSRAILVKFLSCGGNWEEGMQMADAVLTCPNPITVLATKHARSMSSIIPLMADRFLLTPSARYMIHRGSYSTDGLDHEAETNDEERRMSNARMLRIYATRLQEQGTYRNCKLEDIEARLRREMEEKVDVWRSPDKAVQDGFADGVYTGDVANLRVTSVNKARRERMIAVLRASPTVKVEVTW